MKKLAALILSAALLVTPALAAGVDEKFPAKNQYPGYSDVQEGDWFYDNAKLCYEIGLMTGTDTGFEPYGTLTEEEAAVMAARVRSAITGLAIPEHKAGDPWYQPYIYLMEGFVDGQQLHITPGVPITRMRFLTFLNAVLPEYSLTAINSIAALPDTSNVTVLRFYKAGILTGVDRYGTFAGGNTLTRAEAAGMLSRVARTDLRKHFVPASYTLFTAAGVTPTTEFFQGGVTARKYLETVLPLIDELEALCQANTFEFNWLNTYGEQTFLEYVRGTALTQLGVTEDQGTQAYQDFDLQVFYSRYLDLTKA